MDIFIQAFFYFLTYFKAGIYKLLFPYSVFFNLPLKTARLPSLRVRSSGRIYLRNSKFRANVKLFSDGGVISIGHNCFFNNDCSITSKLKVTIGDRSIFGENVRIYDHNHSYDSNYYVSSEHFVSSEIIIGKNCWIGSNVVILKGVKICDNVIIGAGSILFKSITEPGVYVPSSTGVIKLN